MMKKFQNIIGLASILLISTTLTLSSCGGGGNGSEPSEPTLKAINIQGSTTTITVGQQIKLTVSADPSTITLTSVAWTSTSPNVATVNSTGLVTAIGAGTTTIKASTQGKTDTYQITVTPQTTEDINAESIDLDEAATIEFGHSQQLEATVSPSNATNKNIIWKSLNTSVATVNSTGLVEAVGTGTATITATVTNTDDSEVSASCEVTVIKYATSMSLNESSVSLENSESVQLDATVVPSDATYQTVTWKSSDSTIASVDSNGLVTANNAGEATITATLENGSQPDIVKTVTITVNETSSVDGITDNGEIGEVGTN